MFTKIFLNLTPRSRRHVKLNKTYPQDPPEILLNALSDPQDVQTLVEDKTQDLRMGHLVQIRKKFLREKTYTSTVSRIEMTWIPANYNGTCYKDSCDKSTALFLAFLVQYFGKSYDKLLTDVNTSEHDNEKDYDFVIVGAGTAGCVVANRLSEVLDCKILLLEAGGEEPFATQVPGMESLLPNSNLDYGYRTIDVPSYDYARGKVMGGSSSINSMWYVRGSEEDYNGWARNGNDGWSWEEVLPYFKKSENARDSELLEKYPEYHGTSGYLSVERFPTEDSNTDTFINAFKELGFKEIDINSGKQIGVSRLQLTNSHGSRLSANAAFIRPIRGRRSNLVIKTNSVATKVIINRKTKRAIGVEYRVVSNNGKAITKRVYAKKEVIISAGAIDSPKLLLLSGIGPAEELKDHKISVIKDLPVGLNLQDHCPIRQLLVRSNQTISATNIRTRRNELVNWLTTHEGRWAMTNSLGFTAFNQTPLEKQPGSADAWFAVIGEPNPESDIGPYFDNFLFATILLSPKSRGYVKLNKTDPHGKPVIRLNALADPQDVKTLVEGLKYARQIINSKTLKDAGITRSTVLAEGCQHLELDSDDYLECLVENRVNLIAGLHAAGTCKMGPKTDNSSVVDPELKVRGIHGLRVIDTSIMPILVRGNTMAAAIMIGEKGSDLIKKDWQ